MKTKTKLGIVFILSILFFFFIPTLIDAEEITSPYLSWMQDRCAIYDVPFEIVISIAIVESNFRNVRSPINSNGTFDVGIMQLNDRYADWFEKAFWYKDRSFDIWDAEDNIEMGILYLKHLYKQTGNWDLAVRAYNTGLYGLKTFPDRSHAYLVKVINVLNTLHIREF